MPKEEVAKMLCDVDIKDTIECDDVCSSEVKSNISEDIKDFKGFLFPLFSILQSGPHNEPRMGFHCMYHF